MDIEQTALASFQRDTLGILAAAQRQTAIILAAVVMGKFEMEVCAVCDNTSNDST